MTTTPGEIRADMASRQKQMLALAEKQVQQAQELAEVLCPFEVEDKINYSEPGSVTLLTVKSVTAPHPDFPGGAEWLLRAEHKSGAVYSFTEKCLPMLRKVAPEPAPDPEVEAGMAEIDAVLGVMASLYPTTPIRAKDVERIIAALDAVRAERRARVQDARVEAALEILRGCFNDSSVSWDGLAKRILAAADAAEARDA